ncbi:MAG: hypothetical protein K6T86_04820 [Pirellulales bacterium]|nr:hypothetical protein [Pirellulales bacterium]
MMLLAVLATCWLAAALTILLQACWPEGMAIPDLYCLAAMLWARRARGAAGVWCGALLGLASDLSGGAALGPGVAVFSLAGWLASLAPSRGGAVAEAVTAGVMAGGMALMLRVVLAGLAWWQGGGELSGWNVAADAVASAILTAGIGWGWTAILLGRRRNVVPRW